MKQYRMISRRYRNRRIGDFLKELKLVEGRNTGIPTILRSMASNGSALPVFETDLDRTYFTVILPVHEAFLTKDDDTDLNTGMKNEPVKKTRRSIIQIKELILLTLQKNGNLSTGELARSMGYSKVTGTVSKAVGELMNEGRIAYTDPEKVYSRNQKICLTEK